MFDWGIIFYADVRFLNQPADLVCLGTGHRYCGRQWNCRRRGCICKNGRRTSSTYGSDIGGNERSRWRCCGHYVGNVCRVCSCCLSFRAGGDILSSIFIDARGCHCYFRYQRVDIDTRFMCAFPKIAP